jgi:hypothetical protein
MKKSILFFAMLFIGMVSFSYAQKATTKDFYAGTWEILVKGTPNGDAKMLTTLTRVDGKLTGVLSSATDPSAPKMQISKVDETETGITIYFYAEGMDIDLNLKKQDENNLKGSLMNGSFESTAVRK